LETELEEESFDATVFSKNRDRLVEHEMGRLFSTRCSNKPERAG
jgi:hypothetical protein